jgi:hypothetical protein
MLLLLPSLEFTGTQGPPPPPSDRRLNVATSLCATQTEKRLRERMEFAFSAVLVFIKVRKNCVYLFHADMIPQMSMFANVFGLGLVGR